MKIHFWALRGNLSKDDIKLIIYPFEENDPSMVPASYPVDDLKILKFLLAISCIKTNKVFYLLNLDIRGCIRCVSHPGLDFFFQIGKKGKESAAEVKIKSVL